jgi:DNA-binding transcriptional ArsR family regulator
MQSVERDLPIFRSAGQARLLTLLLAGPGDEWLSLSEAARRLRLAPSTVQREAERLIGAGLLESERMGNTRRIRADRSSRFFPELRALVLKAAGPVPVISQALTGVPGIAAAHIFGSWARRIAGDDDDEPPRDVDLLVVGDPDPGVVYAATADAGRVLGQDVDPVIVTRAEWQAATGSAGAAFLRAVREGPLVHVPVPPR